MLTTYPLALLASLAASIPAVDVERATVAQLEPFAGRVVRCVVTVGTTDRQAGWTSAAVGGDQVERVVSVPGEWSVKEGRRIEVLGVLEVRRFAVTVVMGKLVPAWETVEVRGVVVR